MVLWYFYIKNYHTTERYFFDQKNNYSINVQIINMPNWNIVDYASGFWDNLHDTYCFAFIKLGQNPFLYLKKNE